MKKLNGYMQWLREKERNRDIFLFLSGALDTFVSVGIINMFNLNALLSILVFIFVFCLSSFSIFQYDSVRHKTKK